MKDSFYLEFKFIKPVEEASIQELKLKPYDFSQVKGYTITLKNQLDHKVIAQEAVDLNLKLMKWRMVPGLNLDVFKETKCLMLGSGSLGC